jgi:hypothetical protein
MKNPLYWLKSYFKGQNVKEICQSKKCCLAKFLKMFLKFPIGVFYLDSFGAFITILQMLEFKAAW